MGWRLRIATGLLVFTPALATAQGFTAQRAEGAVIPLGDGRTMVLQVANGALTVAGFVADDSASSTRQVDVALQDVIVSFGGMAKPGIAQVNEAFEKAPVGKELSMTVQRGGREHVVTFTRVVAAAASNRVTISAGGSSGLGAWVTGGASANVSEMDIAGARIRENSQGMPEVVSRGSHPAAATVALRTGDVIVKINARQIPALAGLNLFYGEVAVGGDITLVVQRGGREETITFKKPADR